MAMTFRQFSKHLSPLHPLASLVDLSNTPPEHVRAFRVSARYPDPINVDIAVGIPQAMPSSVNGQPGPAYPAASRVGAARSATVGRDVVVNCTASCGASITLEDSADGTAWGNDTTFSLPAGDTLGLRFTPSLGYYRATVTAFPGQSVKQVHVTSQLRDSSDV